MLMTQLAILLFGYLLLLVVMVYSLHWLAARYGLKRRNWYTVVRILCLVYAAVYLLLPFVVSVEHAIIPLSVAVMVTAIVNIENTWWHPRYPRVVRGLYASLFLIEHFMATFFFVVVLSD